MNEYVIVLTAPTAHMIFDDADYFKAYRIKCAEEDFADAVERKQREFSLEFKVSLPDVEHLLTYKVKAQS